ncbi:MAG: Fur family transcriptional regulator [Deltaproteobacteria bacterium]|jgi:Fe2+ or Zn2+ uptake regulation protein|nr:Fur family transcriptional regulator [Deltaproteobacteria bacterium]
MIHKFDPVLRGIRLKATPRRLAILDILADEPVYLSPEEVWQKMRRKGRRVGLPTVYRNLDELAQNGVVIKIVHPDRRLYYYFCPNDSHHHHFVCISCRKVEDLAFCGLDAIEREVKRNLKGAVVSHLLQVYGHCKACLKG